MTSICEKVHSQRGYTTQPVYWVCFSCTVHIKVYNRFLFRRVLKRPSGDQSSPVFNADHGEETVTGWSVVLTCMKEEKCSCTEGKGFWDSPHGNHVKNVVSNSMQCFRAVSSWLS